MHINYGFFTQEKKLMATLIEINWYEERKLRALEERRKLGPFVTNGLSKKKKKKLKPPFPKHRNWRDNVPI